MVTLYCCNGMQITDGDTICNAFNMRFSTVGKKTQESIKAVNPNLDPLSTVKDCKNRLNFGRVTQQEICKIVEKMKPKHSAGYDDVSNLLLKKIVNVIKLPLCVIFNKSLSSGVYPDLMKLAKVIPLHKGGEMDICDNYHPISLLPVISKVLEKVVFK